MRKKARPLREWDESFGDVLWWSFPISEAPYLGSPLHEDFPDYVTHWTPLEIPDRVCDPDTAKAEAWKSGFNKGLKDRAEKLGGSIPMFLSNPFYEYSPLAKAYEEGYQEGVDSDPAKRYSNPYEEV